MFRKNRPVPQKSKSVGYGFWQSDRTVTMPIDMLFRPLFLLLLVAQLGGCLRDEAAICAEKISKVEYLGRQTQADLFRARAECQAQAIEFGQRDPDCEQTSQFALDYARHTMKMIQARQSEPDYVTVQYFFG